jgi:hypothetical protein
MTGVMNSVRSRGQQAADDRNAKRLAQLGAGHEPERDRLRAHDRRHRGLGRKRRIHAR